MSEMQWLEKELNQFAKKYYLNVFLQRLAIFIFLAFVIIFIASSFEYAFWMGSGARRLVFFTGIGLLFIYFLRFLSGPLIDFLGFKKSLSDKDFALIIGKHFNDIDDKILNILELNQEEKFVYSRDLILASIKQKIDKIRIKNFNYALDKKKTLKRLPFVFIPLLFFIIMSFSIPDLIIDPLKRISNFSTEYERPAPFKFLVLNKNMSAPQNSDFELKVLLKGSEIPDEIYIEYGFGLKRMYKNEDNLFIYSFKKIKKEINFKLTADGFSSSEYTIEVFKNPVIVQYNLKCNYPSYTGKESEIFTNISQLIVPRGTKISISVLTRDAEKLHVFSDSLEWPVKKDERYWILNKMFLQPSKIYMFTSNKRIKASDSLEFIIDVIPDEYPLINVLENVDSLALMNRYFTGSISDDYGLSRLEFSYQMYSDNYEVDSTIAIKIDNTYNEQEFYNAFDFSVLGLKPGDRLEYYFRVYDNDAVSGAKSSKSKTFVFKMPNQEELDKYLSDKSDQIENELNQLFKDASSVQEEMEKLLNDLKYKNKFNWEEKEKINNVLKKEKDIEERLNQINQENKSKMQLEQQLGNYNQEIYKKQQMIDELMDDIMSDELREMLKQLEELMKMDDRELKKNLEKMQKDNEDLLQNMDRTIELYKHLKAEKELEKIIEKLDELGNKEIEESNSDTKELRAEKQEELNKEFDKLKEQVDSLLKLNEELEDPFSLEGMEEKLGEIDSTMQKAGEQLDKGKTKKGGKSQKAAGEQMKELSQQLEAMKAEMEQESVGEDIKVIREILENLIQTSFDQEKIMKSVLKTRASDPKYIEIIRSQKQINDNFITIRDSLIAIGKRQAMIKNYISEELNTIMFHGDRGMIYLNRRQSVGAATEQQFTLMSMNNLALLLADALKDMQNAMNQQMECNSKSQCKKSGKNKGQGSSAKPSAKTLRQLQEQLNQQMEALQKQMQEGGGKKQSYSEQLAKMAAEQEMIRKALQEYQQELNSEKAGNGQGLNQTILDMEKTEEDLVYKRLSIETIKRQREILTRLLESEKAEKERDLDEQRQSEEAKFINNGNPVQYFKYNSLKRRSGMEILKTVPPNMNPFYKQKVSEYLYKLK